MAAKHCRCPLPRAHVLPPLPYLHKASDEFFFLSFLFCLISNGAGQRKLAVFPLHAPPLASRHAACNRNLNHVENATTTSTKCRQGNYEVATSRQRPKQQQRSQSDNEAVKAAATTTASHSDDELTKMTMTKAMTRRQWPQWQQQRWGGSDRGGARRWRRGATVAELYLLVYIVIIDCLILVSTLVSTCDYPCFSKYLQTCRYLWVFTHGSGSSVGTNPHGSGYHFFTTQNSWVRIWVIRE
jgi:hypothetical protein